MKQFVNILQHPLLKMFVAPLAYILIGLILGYNQAGYFAWLDSIYLLVMVISGDLVCHYYNITYNRRIDNAKSQAIIIALEIILFISAILLLWGHHWILIVLVLLYLIYIHVAYFPYNISYSWYDWFLSVFFKAFILNVISCYIQVKAITSTYLIQLIPFILFTAGGLIITSYINRKMSRHLLAVDKYPKPLNITSLILMVTGISYGLFLSRPSSSFWLVQILFGVISLLLIIPLIVPTHSDHQQQNKINYIHTITLIFSLLYGLSILF